VSEPEFCVLLTVWSVFKNAFIEAFEQSVEGMVHFYETRSHLFDLTTNLVIDETSGTLAVQKDEL
jgi:hypothetical protein